MKLFKKESEMHLVCLDLPGEDAVPQGQKSKRAGALSTSCLKHSFNGRYDKGSVAVSFNLLMQSARVNSFFKNPEKKKEKRIVFFLCLLCATTDFKISDNTLGKMKRFVCRKISMNLAMLMSSIAHYLWTKWSLLKI